MQDLFISGTRIRPGSRANLSIPIARLPIHTPVMLSVSVYRSSKPGPTILLMGGIHGDELIGVEVVRRMIAEDQLDPETGTIIAIPVVNLSRRAGLEPEFSRFQGRAAGIPGGLCDHARDYAPCGCGYRLSLRWWTAL